MTNYWQFKDNINRLFNTPKHRGLKYASFIVIALVILAQIAMIIWRNDVSGHTKSFIQGCIGVGAIIFVVLIGIWAYKVFSEYFSSFDR